ncbi:argininosuccinate lyase [Clostridium cavendishii DSM 21758]|uniref:Argininosuccinate lyase n=1 Tax=Clostridium cavendishii DSM 21758 TaxID=1121302 RepID=A0A1M6EP39_9CLOT|nr:argininosuccinate lyase [Clostridium cavendishii]SHI87193.1 argininosuccinate lyase [Clostridium cavendishii DSM 21758]
MKLWSGRFQKDVNEEVNDFNASIDVDYRMYEEDIEGSIAHVNMIAKCGIIKEEEGQKIVCGLNDILTKIKNGELSFSKENEDVHMNIETMLIDNIGEVAKKLHTARSRNDQVALDIRIYLKKEILNLKKLILDMEKVLLRKGEENLNTIMPGYTHMQKAQPITFSHHLMAYSEMFKRDYERLEDCYRRMNAMPLGSGALATTTYPINRVMVKEVLRFDKVMTNSIDGVSDRDFVLELASSLSILMMHLSRFSEEVILWCSQEFNYVELDDAYSTGSSIMPQKKNPDVAELVRGKTGRVYGNLMGLLTIMKGLPLAYNKDMQEDKEQIFDSVDTVKICLSVFAKMIDTMKVNKENMEKACRDGFINATDLADYMVKKGMSFRDAHHVTGEIVFYAIKEEKVLEEISLEKFKEFSQIFEIDVYEAIDIRKCVENRKVIGGPSPEEVKVRLKELKEFIIVKANERRELCG